MLKPGDQLGDMVITTWQGENPMIWDYCDPIITQPGPLTVARECEVPVAPKLFIGYGFVADTTEALETSWLGITWELALDGLPVDLSAFGTRDFDSGAKFRLWNVVLEKIPPGKHTLHYLFVDQGKPVDVTWTFTVASPERAIATITPHFYRGSELNIHYRASSLVQDDPGTLNHGPRAGDRAPDAPLRSVATDEPTSILSQFRTTRCTLLLFDDPAYPAAADGHLLKIARSIRERFPDDVQVRFVISADGRSALPDGMNEPLLDADRQAHHIYGVRGEALYLIRPDGYIGYRSQPTDEGALLQYIDKIFS